MNEGIDDPMEDAPEIEVKEDGSVSLIEEEHDPTPQEEETPQAEETQVDEPATPVEQEAVDTTGRVFEEAGLEKLGYRDAEDALRRMPELYKWAHELNRTRAEDNKGQVEQPPSQDEFYDKPEEYVQKLVNQGVAAVNRELESIKVNSFVSSKDDLELMPGNKMYDAMDRQLAQNPGLSNLPRNEMLKVLYGLAKAGQIPEIVSATEKKASTGAPDSSKAQLSTGKPKRTGDKTLKDWAAMSPEEIEKEIGVKD